MGCWVTPGVRNSNLAPRTANLLVHSRAVSVYRELRVRVVRYGALNTDGGGAGVSEAPSARAQWLLLGAGAHGGPGAPVRLVNVGNLRHQRVVRVGVCQQRADGQQHLRRAARSVPGGTSFHRADLPEDTKQRQRAPPAGFSPLHGPGRAVRDPGPSGGRSRAPARPSGARRCTCLANSERRRPLLLQDVQANAALPVDVGVVHLEEPPGRASGRRRARGWPHTVGPCFREPRGPRLRPAGWPPPPAARTACVPAPCGGSPWSGSSPWAA